MPDIFESQASTSHSPIENSPSTPRTSPAFFRSQRPSTSYLRRLNELPGPGVPIRGSKRLRHSLKEYDRTFSAHLPMKEGISRNEGSSSGRRTTGSKCIRIPPRSWKGSITPPSHRLPTGTGEETAEHQNAEIKADSVRQVRGV
ncbi:hypothetical protein GMRT_14974 [Giardia muris]|uniref:Uncharacterized protein n=1 Tax=Giardia muris TaxID=5742 RepID=A0A4Z1T1H9_GIAMU|nr:hypothetical protein GMRT_14974 [Giardia muris]|eukprot:TNJ26797.1 hypothetical protein GMRT_14974 [Giardia muris]